MMFGAFWAIFGLCEIILWGALVTPLILPFAVIPRGRRERFSIVGGRVFGWLCTYVTCMGRTTILGRENLPRKRGYLVISNHRSWEDVGLLMYVTSSQGISKKEVAYIPFFGLTGYVSGVIYFDRTSKESRQKVVTDAIAMMKLGANLHVFPEGTRTRTGRVNEKVFLRLVQACWEHGVDVIPAAVWGTERAVRAAGVHALPFQRFGMQLAPPVDRLAYGSADAYAAAGWAMVVRMARAHGADQPFSPVDEIDHHAAARVALGEDPPAGELCAEG
ncbi:MAG: 1-acyl-sn-glycerol-3-phosphate acyltransferase [Myxococcales bacterium]|nr:1-acyl-sn-glycerol-3-phosphate acyltransferase [Myxococcales bacterium]